MFMWSGFDTAPMVPVQRPAALGGLKMGEGMGWLWAAPGKRHNKGAGVVATAAGMLALGQRLDRLALVERRAIDHHQLALAGCRRIEFFQCHRGIAL